MRCRWVRVEEVGVGWEDRLIDRDIMGLGRWSLGCVFYSLKPVEAARWERGNCTYGLRRTFS